MHVSMSLHLRLRGRGTASSQPELQTGNQHLSPSVVSTELHVSQIPQQPLRPDLTNNHHLVASSSTNG